MTDVLPGMQSAGEELLEECRLTILAGQMAHPRSAQIAPGPSEIGTPCTRKLAYRLAGHPKVNDTPPSWRATVGVAVHSWLETTFGNVVLPDGGRRWLTERRILCGKIGDRELWGTADLFDTVTGTVVDAKVVGPSSLKAKVRHGVGPAYSVQRQVYGLGLFIAGQPVKAVANLILPAAGELSDAVVDIEPFDPDVAIAAIKRANDVDSSIRLAGLRTVLDGAEVVDDFCRYCPWLKRGSTNPLDGCPGFVAAAPAPALTFGE